MELKVLLFLFFIIYSLQDTRAARIRGGGRRGGGSRGSGGWFGSSSGSKGTSSNTGNRGSVTSSPPVGGAFGSYYQGNPKDKGKW